MTGSLNLGHRASVYADYHLLGKLCWTASLFLRKSVVDLISLSVRRVPTLCDRLVSDKRGSALEAQFYSSSEFISALESQRSSKDSDAVATVAQAEGLEGHFLEARVGASLMLPTLGEHDFQLQAQWLLSWVVSALWLLKVPLELQLQGACAS